MGADSGSTSYAGSASSSRTSASKRLRADQDNHDGGDGLLDKRSTLENGVFGVLFTLSKEDNEVRIRNRWVILKIILDGWQLFTTIISPDKQGWAINSEGTIWNVVGVLNFNWLTDLGYTIYLAVLYSMLTLLAINVAMCVWVAWCFKEHKFPVVWPIKALRLFSKVFFQAFDVACLNLLQLGISCRYGGSYRPHFHLDLFPQYKCTDLPHLAHAMVSALCLVLFVAIALLMNMAEVEVNLLCRRPSALGHSGAEVMAFAIKVCITLVQVFIGWPRVAAIAQLLLSIAYAWQYLRWSPHLVRWPNHLKSGVSAVIVWCCTTLTLLVFRPGIKTAQEKTWSDLMTIVMLGGIIPAFCAGALLSAYLIRRLTNTALESLATAKPYLKLRDICKNIDDPRDVEIVARCCRVWKDEYTLDPDAVSKARKVIQAGMAMFPSSAYMVLLHGNFMIDVLGVSQSGGRRIDEARKLNPSLMCRFLMFVRQQEATQNAASTMANGSAGMDLLAYVEYQRKQRMVTRLHREALQAMCNFWKALDSSKVSFMSLSKALGKIETSVSQAQEAYRAVLENYNTDPKLVRLYGRFLQTIKNDPWRAAEYFAEADRLEEMKSGNDSGPLLPDGTPLGRMDDIASAVLVINATGEVQMANRHAHLLFGYKRGMLDMKHMSTLLAPHYSRRTAEKLAALVDDTALLVAEQQQQQQQQHDTNMPAVASSNAALSWNDELVVGMHSDRLAFPVKMSIQKASGVGEDSTFIVLLDALPVIPGRATLWVAPNGTVTACDPQFVANFGWKPAEVNGSVITALLACKKDKAGAERQRNEAERETSNEQLQNPVVESPSDLIKRLLQAHSTASAEAESTPGLGVSCFVHHKYDTQPVACALEFVERGLAESPVHEIQLRMLLTDLSHLMVVSRKGTILHVSPELIRVFKDTDRAGTGRGNQPGGAGGGNLGVGGANAGKGLDPTIALGGIQLAGDPLAGYTLPDFLPAPWKDMHVKHLKAVTTVSPPSRGPWACRKSTAPGPILEMRSASGKPLFMRVAVTTSELTGEVHHVVRMQRASSQSAVAERRLRLVMAQDGRVNAVSDGTPPQLFGFESAKMVGKYLWDFIDWSAYKESGALPESGVMMFTALVKRAITMPGHSWRVAVSPPGIGSQTCGAAGGLQDMLASARVSMARQAVLQVHVKLPTGDGTYVDQPPELCVELWPLSSVTGVMELDPQGRIRSVLEEVARPVGLLFGLPGQALVGTMFSDLVEMPTGRARPGDLLTLNAYKKSSLKNTSQEATVKMGPVHPLPAIHADGLPLMLEVQVVGRPGPGQAVHVILRFHEPAVALRPITAATTGGAFSATAVPRPLRTGSALDLAGTSTSAGGMQSPAGQRQQRVYGAQIGYMPSATPRSSVPPFDELRTALVTASLSVNPVGTPPRVSASPKNPGMLSFHEDADGGSGGAASSSNKEADVNVLILPQAPSPAPTRGEGTYAVAAPPAPPDSVMAVLGDGVPVPGVTTGKAGPPAAVLSPGRSKLADLVRSVGQQPLPQPHLHRRRSSTMGSEQLGLGLSAVSPMKVAPACPLPGDSRVSRLSSVVPSAGITTAVVVDTGAGEEEDEELTGLLSPGVEALLRVTADGAILKVTSVAGSGGSNDSVKARFDTGPVSTWVATQGALYQNSVAQGDDEDEDEPSRKSDDEALPAGAVDKPGGLRALLRAGFSQEFKGHADAAGKSAGAAAGAGPGSVLAGGPGRSHQKDQAPYPEDDMASEGGQSAMSAQSGSGEAEYKRGKRFRKLSKLMDSSQAQQAQRRFWIHALVTVAILGAVHIVFFVLTVTSVAAQKNSMVQLSRAGQSQRFMHELMTDVRSLDVISANKTSPNLYTPENATGFIRRISQDSDEVQVRLKEILDSHHSSASKVMSLFHYSTRAVWDGYYENGTEKFTNLSLWDFATRFYVLSKQIEQNGATWLKEGHRITNTTPGYFLVRSGPDLWRASRLILDALLFEAVDNAQMVAILQIVFLTIEGIAISSLAACYLAFLLRTLAAQRFKLYGTFLVIPVGLTRALASQNTNLMLSDEEDDDDDDDDEEELAPSIESGIDDHESSGLVTPKHKRRATLNVVDAQESGDGTGGRRGGGGGGPRSMGIANPPPYGNLDKCIPSMQLMSGTMTSDSADALKSPGCWAGFTLRLRHLFKRKKGVVPLPSSFGDGGHKSSGSPRRLLKYDSHDTFLVLLPFLMWSALVIGIYAAAVVKVDGITEIVAVHSVANFLSARTYRAVFFSQELAVIEDPAQLAANRAAVANVTKVVRDAWFTLMMGDQAYRAAGPATERFPLVKNGLAYASSRIADELYRSGVCHRLPEHMPCPGPDYRYYSLSVTSLDSIMHVFLLNLNSLAADPANQTVGLADERMDYIYNVGSKDLMDGIIKVQRAHYDTIISLFQNILVMHVMLFLLFWIIFSGFFILLLSPLLKRVTRERRRIAELMSQLPLELDVVKLVARALDTAHGAANGAAGAGRNAGAGGLTSPGHNGGAPPGGGRTISGEAGGGKGESEGAGAFNKWKAIIRMSSNQAKLQQQGDGSVRVRKGSQV